MPKVVDYENLENNIISVFMDTLRRGGIDTENAEALAKIKHNTFEDACGAVYDCLFKPDKTLINNQLSLLPYDNNDILKRLVYIYNRLCIKCNKSNGVYGFSTMTGYGYSTLNAWLVDQLNPGRIEILKNLQETRRHTHINRLQDTPLGDVAVANNDAELGLNWAKNNAPQIAQKAVYILPAEQTRKEISAGLPYAITSEGSEESA